jgi:hypothetical protein
LCAGIAIALPGCEKLAGPRQFAVGQHHIRFVVPHGWEAQDLDGQVLLRHGASQLVLQDLAPAGPAGIRREVEQARELWRQGRSRDARWRMRAAAIPSHLFETAGQRKTFWVTWAKVSGAPEDADFAVVESAFDEVMATVAAIRPRALDALVENALAELDLDRSDVTQRRAIAIGGREGLVVDSWDRLSHARERRIALVLNQGHLLALRTEWGDPQPMKLALDAVLATLQFGSAEPTLVGRPASAAVTY